MFCLVSAPVFTELSVVGFDRQGMWILTEANYC